MLAKENDVLDKNLQRNNEMQLKATKKALSSRFTLIQGPPGTCLLQHNDQTLSLHRIYFYSAWMLFSLIVGTGKTLTGIKLILLFTKVNQEFRKGGGDHHQVVYCGPSNKSVDLVARMSSILYLSLVKSVLLLSFWEKNTKIRMLCTFFSNDIFTYNFDNKKDG